jgi:hypothetical protein
MLGRELLHNTLKNTLEFVHAKRLSALMDAVESLLHGKKLTLTLLGRSMLSESKERHCIRKMDRLLGNKHLHEEIPDFYKGLNILVLKGQTQPIISIDWSSVNKRKDWHILRATLNIQGRGMVLYQETHPRECENSPKVHMDFLNNLRIVLPEGCQAIIVTDAGFGCPWFRAVEKLGFDWVSRIRSKAYYQKEEEIEWKNCLDLYEEADNQARKIGLVKLSKRQALRCHLVLYKGEAKHRKDYGRNGECKKKTESRRCARRARDPWLLATSLDMNMLEAKEIVNIYEKRMQIEEDFRDTKSHQYGFGLRYSRTNCGKRLNVLLLIAALGSLICWLMSLIAREKNLHRDYQANSIRGKNVLSVVYLACQLVRRKVSFSKSEFMRAFTQFHLLISEAAL